MTCEDDDLSAAWHHEEQLHQQQIESGFKFYNRKEMTMGLMAKDGGGDGQGGKFQNAPAGAYVARCWRVVDLGTQQINYEGKTKLAHQVLLSWELSSNMEDGKPYIISEKYTLSLNEKARLTAVLEGWRGAKFTDVERAGFDLKNVLGKVCFLNVVHATRNGKTYANVASVMPIPKGMPSPTPVNEEVFYSIEEHRFSIPESLSLYHKKMIVGSPEYQNLGIDTAAHGNELGGEINDDDIPF